MPTSRSPFFLFVESSNDCAFQAIVAATAINWSDLSYYSLFYHILSYVLHEAIVATRTYCFMIKARKKGKLPPFALSACSSASLMKRRLLSVALMPPFSPKIPVSSKHLLPILFPIALQLWSNAPDSHCFEFNKKIENQHILCSRSSRIG